MHIIIIIIIIYTRRQAVPVTTVAAGGPRHFRKPSGRPRSRRDIFLLINLLVRQIFDLVKKVAFEQYLMDNNNRD